LRWQDNIEAGETILANLEAILADWSAETISSLGRAIYKGTNCGAYLSVQLHDETWKHTGHLDGIYNGDVRQLLVGSIIEGSDAEVCADAIDLLAYADSTDAVDVFSRTVEWVDDEVEDIVSTSRD